MSGEMALWAARQDIDNLAAKMTLIALADSYDDTTEKCFPSHQTISEFVRRGRTQIKEALRWLEKEGWIARATRFTETKRQTSNGYTINFNRGESFEKMLERRKKIRGGGKPTPGGKPTGEGAETRPIEGAETRPPLTLLNEQRGAGARISKSLKEAEPLLSTEPIHLERRKKVGALMQDFSASLRMSQAGPPQRRRRKTG